MLEGFSTLFLSVESILHIHALIREMQMELSKNIVLRTRSWFRP